MNVIRITTNAVSKAASKPIDFAKQTTHEVQSFLMARAIMHEMAEGATIESCVLQRIPDSDAQAVTDEIEMLVASVERVRSNKEKLIDGAWVKEQLTKAMSSLTNKERVTYLTNLITAVSAVYPNVIMDEETTQTLEAMKAADENTDEEVASLLGMVETVLPKVGALLQQVTISAMMKRMHKLDHTAILREIDDSERFVTAYAAARYVMQKNGHLDGDDQYMSPALLGATSATRIESSRLMGLYNDGKLTLEALKDALNSLYTGLMTYFSEDFVHDLARLTHLVITVSVALFIWAEYANSVILTILMTMGAISLIYEFLSPEILERYFRNTWRILMTLWEGVKETWNNLIKQLEIMDNEDENETEQETMAEEISESHEESEDANETEGEDAFA